MAYKCLDCGHIFEDGEEAHWREGRGEFWGFSCSEEMTGCPLCHGDYKETTPCAVCGAEHLEDELFGGVCEECIDVCRKDFDLCEKICTERKEISISWLLASIFEPSDIEQILKEYIKERMPDVDCSAYIDEDIDVFGEALAEEVKKG